LDQLDEGAIASVASELAKLFKDQIVQELPGYKTAIQQDARGELYQSGADIAHDVASALPVIGTIVAFADAASHATEFFETAKNARSVVEQQDAFAQAQRRKAERIQYTISNFAYSKDKKAKLLNAVAMLSDVHGIAIGRA
jgi:hypothetical protein